MEEEEEVAVAVVIVVVVIVVKVVTRVVVVVGLTVVTVGEHQRAIGEAKPLERSQQLAQLLVCPAHRRVVAAPQRTLRVAR